MVWTKRRLAHAIQSSVWELILKEKIWVGAPQGISIYDGKGFRNYSTAD